MHLALDDTISQHLLVCVIAVLIGAAISLAASMAGYYRYPFTSSHNNNYRDRLHHYISWPLVALAFAIFLFIELIVVPGFYLIWVSLTEGSFILTKDVHLSSTVQGWLNIFAIVLVAAVFLCYIFLLPKGARQLICGTNHWFSLVISLLLGVISWFIVYPWIIALSQLIGIAMEMFHIQHTNLDQVAVKQVKDIMNHPLLLWSMIPSIVLIVPFVEELLFRGFLQTWLKGMYSVRTSILITSAVFASFHYSSSQGVENIELLGALFLLSCYLGFIRERQNSIVASFGLHATFNLVSLFMILATHDMQDVM